jgi:hypothetical protein
VVTNGDPSHRLSGGDQGNGVRQPTESTKPPPWRSLGHKGRIAVLVTVEFASNIFNSRADPFHRSDNFICWHIEAFGPVPQFVIFIWVDELALRCPRCLCHLMCPSQVPLDGNRLEATPGRLPSNTAVLEGSGARD